jgi:hypothetical protein
MEFFTTMIQETNDWTISNLRAGTKSAFPLCYILQDGKVGGGKNGKGRIPAGRYKLAFNTTGKMHQQYARRYVKRGKLWHRGMIEIVGVPNYKGILFHIGNSPVDTLGCPLTGMKADFKLGRVLQSATAYEKVYPILRDAVLLDSPSYITVTY